MFERLRLIAARVVAPRASARLLSEEGIAHLVKRLTEVRGWKVSYASRMASGSGDTVDRLSGGIGMTLTRAAATVQRCPDLRPEDRRSESPKHIARPERTEAGDA